VEAAKAEQEGYGDWHKSAIVDKIVFLEYGVLTEELVPAV
jgi:hypothetical protein